MDDKLKRDSGNSSTSSATLDLRRALARARLVGELRRTLEAMQGYAKESPGEVDNHLFSLQILLSRLENAED